MKTITQFFKPSHNNQVTVNEYEVIENETLKNSDFNQLNISGSLFSLTTFVNVTFESCVFFGSRIENCMFINCNFSNCKFQFTEITHSTISKSKFTNCIWDISFIKKSLIEDSTLGSKTYFFASKENNSLINCKNSDADFVELTETFLFQEAA